MSLPDMLDACLPSPKTKSLLMSLILAHRSRMLHASQVHGVNLDDKTDLEAEATYAEMVAAWLESVPTRKA